MTTLRRDSLLIPLLARTHGRGAGAAGLVIGAQGVGAILITLLVARSGTTSRPGSTALAQLSAASQCRRAHNLAARR
jgi:hypothetical protein